MEKSVLTEIWLTPPLAFGRVGSSPTPCDAFAWGPNDLTADGSGSTTLVAMDTLTLDDEGNVSSRRPEVLVFRDNERIRPVCPYFELHGSWRRNGRTASGPITMALLEELGVALADIQWEIRYANLKVFDYTLNRDDRIEVTLNIAGRDTTRHELQGRSPAGSAKPLVPAGVFLPMGAVQAAKPSAAFPQIRMRFYAPAGLTYAPTNIEQRIAAMDLNVVDTDDGRPNREWPKLKIPKAQQILNPESDWASYADETSTLLPLSGLSDENGVVGPDLRHVPTGMYVAEAISVNDDPDLMQRRSLCLIDDVGDGIITCSLSLASGKLSASARIVVGPPDFAPANRPPISLADNLADRADRAEARKKDWSLEELREVVHDIFERAFEASSLMNKDYQNARCHNDNATSLSVASGQAAFFEEEIEAMLWPDITLPENIQAVREGRADPLPLSGLGIRKHRRYLSVEYLEDRFRENPELFKTWIRGPLDPNPFFDKRMPALMRGSDTRPWHLTRRQWEIVRLWVQKLQEPAAAKPAGKEKKRA